MKIIQKKLNLGGGQHLGGDGGGGGVGHLGCGGGQHLGVGCLFFN